MAAILRGRLLMVVRGFRSWFRASFGQDVGTINCVHVSGDLKLFLKYFYYIRDSPYPS